MPPAHHPHPRPLAPTSETPLCLRYVCTERNLVVMWARPLVVLPPDFYYIPWPHSSFTESPATHECMNSDAFFQCLVQHSLPRCVASTTNRVQIVVHYTLIATRQIGSPAGCTFSQRGWLLVHKCVCVCV